MDRRGLWISRSYSFGSSKSMVRPEVPAVPRSNDAVVEDANFCDKGLAAWYASHGKSLLPAQPTRSRANLESNLRSQVQQPRSGTKEENKQRQVESCRKAQDNSYKWVQRGTDKSKTSNQKLEIRKPPCDYATDERMTRSSSVCSGQESVGVLRFWTFVAEALKGPASQDPICRHFRLYSPSSTTRGEEDVSSKTLLAGVKLVLGDILSKTSDDGVGVVRATQRWALVKVPGLAESIKSYRLSASGDDSLNSAPQKQKTNSLNTQEVKAFLCNFQPYMQFLEKYGSELVPSDEVPKGWKLHAASCEKRFATIGGSALKGMDAVAFPQRSTAKIAKAKGREQQSVEHSGIRVEQRKLKAKQLANKEPKVMKKLKIDETRKKASLANVDAPRAKVAKAKGRPKRAAPEGDEAMHKKTKTSHGSETKVVPKAKCQAKAPIHAKALAAVREEEEEEASSIRVVQRNRGKCCGVCGRAELQTPKSCSTCTKTLFSQRSLSFSPGMRVWCRGFGPMWPACIDAIGFKSAEDKEPYRVRFYGDGRHAWVCESKFLSWELRRPPQPAAIPSRWRKSMAKAIKEAEEDKSDDTIRY